jgi:hypothetical protein
MGLSRLTLLLVVAASFIAHSASSTIVASTRIAIETQELGAARSFTLTYRVGVSNRVRDHGSAIRIVEAQIAVSSPPGVSGTERLASEVGTLMLQWSGRQRGEDARGRWWTVGGTGIYMGRTARGCFVSQGGVTRYRGLMILAR